jgi:hypothetical protein
LYAVPHVVEKQVKQAPVGRSFLLHVAPQSLAHLSQRQAFAAETSAAVVGHQAEGAGGTIVWSTSPQG